MTTEKWRFERSTMTVRDGANHCLFSGKTFANGGTFDAARSADAERLLALAAAAPELLAALELGLRNIDDIESNDELNEHERAFADAARAAIAKAKGGAL